VGIKQLLPALDGQISEVLSKAAIAFFFRILGAVAQFSFIVVLARIFGAEGMGMYVLALSVTVVAAAVSRWGLDQAALKHIAVAAEAQEWGRVRKIFLSAFVLVLSASSIVTLLLFPASGWIVGTFFSQPEMTNTLQIMLLSIIPFSLLNLIAECMRALKNIAAHTLVQVVLIPLFSMATLLLLQHTDVDISAAAYAYLASCITVAVFALLYWRRIVKDGSDSDMSVMDAGRQLLQTANPMALTAIIGIAMSFSETVLLGVFRSASEVGVYAAALRLALLVNFVLVAFNSILAPKFATMFHQKNIDEIEKLVAKSIMLMLVLTLPVFTVCIFMPEYILQLFGAEFAIGSIALIILALGQLVNVMTGPVGILLLMTGHERRMRKNSIISAGLGLLAGLLFIPYFGVNGAALSAVVGILVLQGLSVWSVSKYLKINVLRGFRIAKE